MHCFSSFQDCNTTVCRPCPPNYRAAQRHVQHIESMVNAHSCACCTPVSKCEFMLALYFYASFMLRPDNTWSSMTPASRGSRGIVRCMACSMPAGPCLRWPLRFPMGPVSAGAGCTAPLNHHVARGFARAYGRALQCHEAGVQGATCTTAPLTWESFLCGSK